MARFPAAALTLCGFLALGAALIVLPCCAPNPGPDSFPEVSGIYPHLAVSNSQSECGIGAVVPWAGRLWAVTYSPHRPEGSDDKLYTLDGDLNRTTHPESVGGTPANRMIHSESEQLIIGPYFIGLEGNVRVICPQQMLGRLTATARHLVDPQDKVYFFTMEEGLYEVDVHSLEVETLFTDRHRKGTPDLLPGYHGKGAYTGQRVLVTSNNGASGWQDPEVRGSGSLAEWDGREWAVVEESQFTEVTGPGGIQGAENDEDPIWASGWDERSVKLKLRHRGQWSTFRLPKASFTYDGKHGWHTEWPRIREIGEGRALMTMHGMFWDFPLTFRTLDRSGLRPLSSYLKMVVDFCLWEDRLVLACNDASKFDNALVGQAQSNFWFLDPADLTDLGPVSGFGGVWLEDDVKAGQVSDPFLFQGFDWKALHLAHESEYPVLFRLEVDGLGTGEWREVGSVSVPGHGYAFQIFPSDIEAAWVRVSADRDCRGATAYFHYSEADAESGEDQNSVFTGLSAASSLGPFTYGVIRISDNTAGDLEFLAAATDPDGQSGRLGHYLLGSDLRMQRIEDPEDTHTFLKEAATAGPDFEIDDASILLTDSSGRRFRLPKGDPAFDTPLEGEWPRGIREVVTERSLLNCHGTFYELPRDISGGISGIKPVCTHDLRIHDFCSWKGLLVLTGIRRDAPPDGHVVRSEDGKTGLWLGNVDDLWKLGKPRGRGGPWRDTEVQASTPSDPYLMTGYDRKRVELSHLSTNPVTFRIEVDITGRGLWKAYSEISVEPGELLVHEFPAGYAAHWVRLTADRDCRATALFVYE
jgi:hypothetical protein